MYLRRCFRVRDDGKRHAYWALVQSVRTAKGPRQRVVAYLGDLDEAGRLGVQRAAEGVDALAQQGMFDPPGGTPPPRYIEVDVSGVTVEGTRKFGGPWIALQIISRLGLRAELERLMPAGREEVPWPLMSLVLVICRLCDPSSELRIAEHLYQRSAMADLLGVGADKINDDRLYRALDELLPHKAELEKYLKNRLGELFDLKYDLLLYDVTSTYFEGQCTGNEDAKRGYSRDNRGDCKQVCIALVVSREGMPVGYELFAGNKADVSSVQGEIQRGRESLMEAPCVHPIKRLPTPLNCPNVVDINGNGIPNVNLTVIGYDPLFMTPFELTATTDSTGLAYIPVQGIAAGTTPLLVTDGSGDEGSGTITIAVPSTVGDSEYSIALPGTAITSPNGGTDTIVSHLTISNSHVLAPDPATALLKGIQGWVTVNGLNFTFPDPSHFYIYPKVGSTPPLVIFSPISFTTTTITDLPSPPPTLTIYYTIPTLVNEERLLSLTVTDVNNLNCTQTSIAAYPLGDLEDLYLGQQEGGIVTLELSALETDGETIGPADSSIGWSMPGATPSSGTFGSSPVIVQLEVGATEYTTLATDGTFVAAVADHVGDLTVFKETADPNANPNTPGGGNQPGDPLPKMEQEGTGAFLPFDSLDEDYQGHPDFMQTMGEGAVTKQPITGGDPLLLQIQLNGMAAAKTGPGFYFLGFTTTWKSNTTSKAFVAFEDNTGATQVYDDTTALPVAPVGQAMNIWIEAVGVVTNGVYQGNQNACLNLYWSPTNTFNPNDIRADFVKLQSFTWTGSQDVPGNTTYSYNVNTAGLPKAANGKATGWTQAAAGTISQATLNTSTASVTWDTGPAFGEVVYTVNPSYSWEFTVNVVHVALSTDANSSNNLQTTPNAPDVFHTTQGHGVVISSNGIAAPVNNPLANPNTKAAVTATVTIGPLKGPQVGNGPMRGVKWIVVGFIQQVLITDETGTYTNAGSTDAAQLRLGMTPAAATAPPNNGPKNPQWHIDGYYNAKLLNEAAVLTGNKSIYPWLDSQNQGQALTGGPAFAPKDALTKDVKPENLFSETTGQSVTLTTQDTPVIYGGPDAIATIPGNLTAPISSVSIMASFNLSAAVVTTKPSDPTSPSLAGAAVTDNVYTARATASWKFDGSGTVKTFKQVTRLGNIYTINGFTATGAGATAGGAAGGHTNFTVDNSAIVPPKSDKGVFANQLPYGFQYGGDGGEPLK